MYLKYDGSVALESAANNGVNLWATGPGQTLQGGALNDVLGGTGGDTLIGGLGDNQYYLAGPGNTIVQGETGINTVTTWMSYTLPDNIQNLSISGDGLYAAGNALDNLITVGDTNAMQLYGAGGNNVLVGGAGADTFIIDGTAGSNAVYNWHSGDKLRLLGSNFTTFAQVQAAMTQVGSDVVLQNGLNNLVIRNTAISQFQTSDFYIGLDRTKLGQATFDDEFNSLSLHNAASPTGTWTPNYWYGGVGAYTLDGNGELQLYTAPGFTGTGTTDLGLNPFSISGGVLDIHAQTVTPAQSAAMWNYGYSSGLITTHDSFAQTYGYFEMRAELPTDVSGAWPAFWLVPADGSWPPELDVMETLSGTPNVDYTTEHSAASGAHTAIGSANLVTDVTGFHTYGVLWTASTLTWYLDGQAVFQTATPADMNKPMYMLANMAIGGWAGTPDFTSTDMKIDYIRAYALADGSSSWTSIAPVQTPSAGDQTGGGSGSSSGSSDSSGSSPPPSEPPPSDGTSPSAGGSGSTGGSGSGVAPAVSVSASSYTAPAGVTDVTLTGAQQTVTGNDAGDTFHSNNAGNHLIGGMGADVFFLGRGGDVATGGAGANTFVLSETPWSPNEITDFATGADTLDLRPLLSRLGYAGVDPIRDGYLQVTMSANGSTQIWADVDKLIPGEGMWLAVTIDGVAPVGLQLQDGQITLGSGGLAMGASGPSASTSVTAAGRGYLAPAGVTSISLTGSAQTVTGNDDGDTFIVANNSANHLYGGAGNDTFILGRGGDVATGGGGADTYVFNETPWAAGHITDFDPGHDLIDLSGLLARSGYSGADPIHAGYIKLMADAAGQTQIWSNLGPIAHAGWWLVTTLDGVSVSDVSMLGDFVTVNPNAMVSKASYSAPDGVTTIHLTGANQTIHANNGGDTIWSTDTQNTLIGGTGNDTFHIGRAGDTITGGGGNDTFAYAEVPWGGSHITDFQSGDVIDLTGLMQTTHDTGADPFADGYLRITSDSSGNAQISANYNLPGNDNWWVVATLDHVAASTLNTHGAFITG